MPTRRRFPSTTWTRPTLACGVVSARPVASAAGALAAIVVMGAAAPARVVPPPAPRYPGSVAAPAPPPPALRAAARPEAGPRPSVTNWATEQGLPASQVTALARTPDGFLWLGSYEGLVRFDGAQFRLYTPEDLPGLGRGTLVTLDVAPDGALWVSSGRTVLRRAADGRWRTFGTAAGLPDARITALHVDRAGTVWIGTRTGVWRMRDGRATPLPAPSFEPPPAVTALSSAPDGALWVGTLTRGVMRWDGRGWTARTVRDGLHGDRVDAVHADRDGTIWVGAYGAGLSRIRGARIDAIAVGRAGAPSRIHSFVRDDEGTLWMAAENGLFHLRGDGGLPERVLVEGEGSEPKGEVLLADGEGGIWLGTGQNGLYRVRPASVRTVSAGLPHPFVFAVGGDGADGAWLGTQDGAVRLATAPGHAPRVAMVVRQGQGLAEHVVRDVLRDAAGDVWLATTGGLTRLPGGAVAGAVTYGPADGLADARVRALAPGRDGAVWIATYDGLSLWQGGRLRRFGAAEGLTDGYVLSVHEDRGGTVWVGTQASGLFRRDAAGRFVPGPAALRGRPVFRMSEEPDGTRWLGTSGGLARLRGAPGAERVAILGPRHGIPGGTVYQALEDGRGTVWLTGPWGIAGVARAELHAAADGRLDVVHPVVLTRADGLPIRETASIGRSWRAPDGTLWFPTPRGVAVLDPARLARPGAHAPVVDEVVADGAERPLGAVDSLPVELPAGTRRVEFRFTAPTLVAPEQLHFRWRLVGFDDRWVEGGTRREAAFTNLAPGDYRFEVQARLGTGAWRAVPDGGRSALAVHLAPHLWQTRGFLAACGLAGVGVLGVGYRRRVRAVTRDAQRSTREELFRALALRDDLSALHNRRGFIELAEQALRMAQREGRGVTLLFADLDGLKAVNDGWGHAAGDRLIAEASGLLRATFREADVLARLGGDEFAVLLPDPAPGLRDEDAATHAARAAERLRHAVEAYRRLTPGDPPIALSLGTSRWSPGSPCTLDELLDRADRQMYDAKRAKRQAAPVA